MTHINLKQSVAAELEQETNQFRQARLTKLKALIDQGIMPYPSSFTKSHELGEVISRYDQLEVGQETEDEIIVAGRIYSIRNSGMFIDLRDPYNKIQIFTNDKTSPKEACDLLDLLDLGDFIGVRGLVRKTPRGELTINATEITFLGKALLPMPEKYHGLNDQETRYRQRYLDLLVTEESRQTLRQRMLITSTLRSYLTQNGFLEVETPMLHPIAGGALAKPFLTHHNALDMDLFLRIAPELYLKKLIVGGLSDKIFELNRCFRNEGISTRHNPEFTQVELYWAFADYQDVMTLTEECIAYICQTIYGSESRPFGDLELIFKAPWKRQSMCSLVQEKTGIDFMACNTAEEAMAAAEKIGFKFTKPMLWGEVVELVFGDRVEDTLVQPTHVTELPLDISPLAKVHPEDPRLTERFESFVNGWEIANGFSELNDPLDQRKRFEAQMTNKERGNDEAHEMDEDFITALEYGLPPTGGLGIGIDRLAMLLTNSHTIRDVIAFPTMRPKD